ncbi:TRAP transporter small permease [Tistrella mobilis]|uniref:TRAP transporter small permease n=1 Tax=Tistrella mobilis TaxID=171437 RepID=UPI001E4E8849|nr:TRAP transporter small permease [Tistrella mobilis]
MASSPEHDDVPEAVREVDRPVVSGRIEEFIAALAMAGICVISFGNVVVRYVTNASFAATEELSIFLLVVMTMVGASLAFIRGGHIRITAIVDRLPRRPRMGLIMVTHLLTMIMFALVAWYGWLLTLDEMEYGETSPALGYPSWIYTIWLPLVSVAIILRVIGRAHREWRAFRTHETAIDIATGDDVLPGDAADLTGPKRGTSL